MTSAQLTALVKKLARLAFKEGKAAARGEMKAAKWGRLRARAQAELLAEIAPYDAEAGP
jgi:hypothetical protein